jgi:cytoskeleton protein RodZ
MSEAAPPEGAALAGESAPAAGFGRTLAQARAARGLGVAEVAARLRLHPRQVAALEEERLEALPEAPFVRGFVRNYAKELHLDPAPLLAALERAAPAREFKTPPASAVTQADTRRLRIERGSRHAVIGGGLGLLVVLGVIGWIASQRPALPALEAPQAARTDSPLPPVAIEPAPVAAAAAPAAAAASSVAPASEVAAAALLRLTVGERPSWVEITQGDGRIVLSGLQEPGTDRRIGAAQPPLSVVIGNASSVSLEYRGRRIDLAAHTRANDLARLTLE